MKLAKKIAWALLIIFVGMQFIRPDKNLAEDGHEQAFLTETNPPAEVRTILKESCYDCHSNNTVYPWYNNIAPVSFWIAGHVDEGKEHFNISAWDSYDAKKKDHKLEEVVEVMEEHSMPLNEYTWTHEEARLSQGQIDAILEWAKKTRSLYQLGARPE
ncbi:heme-binding domain-containing protein [Poritiphilus flavus]|uniref:Cytochrome C n=1 Tax=Poritiphilus flavus TaxID=2697053 RepID=A0A6L9EA99_9FLAO|nr:heme-binding domain-containing protein [Poritiphilus flavus]NAS11707.1 cytochrome C [Poritiphilus flavus]